MEDNETKPTMKEFVANDQANYYSGIESIKVDLKLFTYDIERTENYDDYMNGFNDEFEEPWDDDGVAYETGDHICEPFRFKNGRTKWPTCSSNENGFNNGGKLPRMVRLDEALEQKAVYEESWGEHSKAFRFYIIKPNESVEINSIIESRDAIFDENKFSSVPRPSLKIPNGTEDIGSLVVPEEVTEEGFKQKSGIDYLYTYAPVACISIIRLLIAMASIYNLIIHQMDVKTTFLNGELEDEFSMKDMEDVDVILGYTSNPGVTQHWQAIQWVLKYLKKTMDYRLIYTGYPSVLEGYTDAIWINNTEDNSSTSGWVFLLSGSAISWASKKQTCITGSTIEYEFMALTATGKEAKWLKNLLLEIPLWSKPIAPISVHYDSVATLAKSYSQIYNGKSRHLGVRHSMIRELIMNGVFIKHHDLDLDGLITPPPPPSRVITSSCRQVKKAASGKGSRGFTSKSSSKNTTQYAKEYAEEVLQWRICVDIVRPCI
ncbi:zinc finger, CCHC-type containing protein [Tanacetum coccineum]